MVKDVKDVVVRSMVSPALCQGVINAVRNLLSLFSFPGFADFAEVLSSSEHCISVDVTEQVVSVVWVDPEFGVIRVNILANEAPININGSDVMSALTIERIFRSVIFVLAETTYAADRLKICGAGFDDFDEVMYVIDDFLMRAGCLQDTHYQCAKQDASFIFGVLPLLLGGPKAWFDEGTVRCDLLESTLDVEWNNSSYGPLQVQFDLLSGVTLYHFEAAYAFTERISDQASEFILSLAMRIRMFKDLYDRDMRLILHDIAQVLEQHRP